MDVSHPTSGSPPATSWLPSWGQYGVSVGVGHAYSTTLSPWLRNATERLLGHAVDRPFKPPSTPGFVARELAYAIGMTYVCNGITSAILRRAGHAVNSSMLTSAAGSMGASASVLGASTVAAAGAALKGLLARNLLIGAAASLIDAVYGARVGPAIESTVNRVLGLRGQGTTTTRLVSNVPLNTVHQTREQVARSFARNFVSATTYTLLWQAIGGQVARSVFQGVGGPAGAVLGAFAGYLSTNMLNHIVMHAIGTPAANLAHTATRAVERVLGLPLDRRTPNDVIPKVGDEVSGAVGGALIPFLTALVSGQMGNYQASVA